MDNATSKALGLLRIGPGADVEGECNGFAEDLATVLHAKHPKVFDVVDKLKGNKLKLLTRSRLRKQKSSFLWT